MDSCTHPTRAPKETPLQLIVRLCDTLRAEGINYCHWKSTTALDRSASGENDLDLLVSRGDAQAFTAVLYDLGFKAVCSPPEQVLPGILDFYGYDDAAARFVHVHAHYQLVLGDDMTKNYRLAVEDTYLGAAQQGPLFRIPAPELELIVLVIRLVLKHRTWDALLTRQWPLPRSAQRELEDLQARSLSERLQNALRGFSISPALFERCVATLQTDAAADVAIWEQASTGSRLQHNLRGYTRQPRPSDLPRKLWRRTTRKLKYRFLEKPKKHFASGGALVAFVGGDGAGKSSVVQGLYSWLAKDFRARKVHLGKPPWSLTTRLVRGGLKVTLRLESLLLRATGRRSALMGRAQVIRKVCASRDRYHAYLRARRAATQGSIVICDRFPLPQLREMDAPQINHVAYTDALMRQLLHLERRWYAAISAPELLVVLKVDPDTAVQRVLARSPDENIEAARRRSKEVWEHDWQAPAHVVDALRPQAEVESQLKKLLWTQL